MIFLTNAIQNREKVPISKQKSEKEYEPKHGPYPLIYSKKSVDNANLYHTVDSLKCLNYLSGRLYRHFNDGVSELTL